MCFEELEKAIKKEDLLLQEKILKEDARLAHDKKSAKQMLLIANRYPTVDFGTPGPIVHYIENCFIGCTEDIYVVFLIDCFSDCLNGVLLDLVNRYCNYYFIRHGSSDKRLIQVLRANSQRLDITADIRAEINILLIREESRLSLGNNES